jgi:general stress protein 26
MEIASHKTNLMRSIAVINLSQEAKDIMTERFGKDSLIALATVESGKPYVRYVDAYYENGSFYIITYALSNKIKQIEKDPTVAVAGEWFTGHGRGVSLGYFGSTENSEIAEKLKHVFSSWIDNGHNDFDDHNTIILCVELTDGILLSHGTKYEL